MKLVDALQSISYDASWGIYAKYPISADSECRYGQTQFENGGLLDDKKFIIDGESATDRIEDMIDHSLGEEDYQREVAIQMLIDELNDEHDDALHDPDGYTFWDAVEGKQLTGSAAANFPTAPVVLK